MKIRYFNILHTFGYMLEEPNKEIWPIKIYPKINISQICQLDNNKKKNTYF